MKNSRAGRDLQTIWLCWRLGVTGSYRQALFSAMLWAKSRLTTCWSHSNLLHENTFWREEQQGNWRKVFISKRFSLGETWKMQIFYLCSLSPYSFWEGDILAPQTLHLLYLVALLTSCAFENLFLYHQGLDGA
jgi:hypothetical protein